MISQEQAKTIKEQLIKQIESTFPEDKKADSVNQLKDMGPEELEEFLIQNNLVGANGVPTNAQPQKCIFCSIIDGEIPTNKLTENNKAIATLEINPISKGHVLIIPKEHIDSEEKIPKTAFTLAKKIAKKIETKLKPKNILTKSTNLMGHQVINVIPIYNNENLSSQRTPAKKEELEELTNLLQIKKRAPSVRKPRTKKIKENQAWLPKRIP